jgi:hypothetical protein
MFTSLCARPRTHAAAQATYGVLNFGMLSCNGDQDAEPVLSALGSRREILE